VVHDARSWPIGAATLNFSGDLGEGRSLTDGPPEAWRPVLREVALAGFEHVDLTDSWVRPGDLTTEGRSELVRIAGDLGLAFSAISVTRKSIITPDPEQARANFDYDLRTIDAAAQMGVGVVCLGLHDPLLPAQREALWFWLADGAEDPDDEVTWARAVEGFARLGDYARQYDIRISLEMYEGTYLGTSASSVKLAQDIGRPNVGLCPDIGNIVRLHRPVEDWRDMISAMAPYTNYWQAKNYLRDFDPATGAYFSAPVSLESGFIDYRAAVGIVLDAGFDGPFCVEHYGGDGLSVSATNREYLRRVLAAKLGE